MGLGGVDSGWVGGFLGGSGVIDIKANSAQLKLELERTFKPQLVFDRDQKL